MQSHCTLAAACGYGVSIMLLEVGCIPLPGHTSRRHRATERYGLDELQRDQRAVRPVAKASEFVIQAA